MLQLKVGIQDYYDLNPMREHYPGDIWSELPTFGTLKQMSLSGLVITPACDLTNRKVETITYLPVIPVRDFLTELHFLPEIKRQLNRQIEHCCKILDQIDAHIALPDERCFSSFQYQNAIVQIDRFLSSGKIPDGQKLALEKICAGIQILTHIADRECNTASINLVKTLLGEKDFNDQVKKIISNSYRTDLHFLPRDEQVSEYSGMISHSVTLFRYPITAPIEIFDRAQDVVEMEWAVEMSRISNFFQCATQFAHKRPMKRIRLKPRFLSDLISRYNAIYGRIGSPNFSQQTVEKYAGDIEGEQ